MLEAREGGGAKETDEETRDAGWGNYVFRESTESPSTEDLRVVALPRCRCEGRGDGLFLSPASRAIKETAREKEARGKEPKGKKVRREQRRRAEK